jgi:hypothetical protein
VPYSRSVARPKPALISTILLAMVAGLAGCAQPTQVPRLLPPPPKESVRLGLTSVALAPGRFQPKFDVVDGPAKGVGQGAARGALLGAAYTLGGGAFGGPIGLVASVFLTPVGAVGGGIVGGVTAESATKVEERVAAAGRSLLARKIQDDLVLRVASIGREQTSSTFTLLADRGPRLPGELMDYRSLGEEGIQAVLEISVVELSLRGRTGEIDPGLSLAMAVKTRLVRTDDDAQLYANSLTYSGGKGRTLVEWLDDAEQLRIEVDRACEIVAEKIVDEVFLLMPFPQNKH